MKTKLNNDGTLSIDFREVFNDVEPATLLNLIDSLACTDAVIEEVTNQIIEGWTTLRSNAGFPSRDGEPRNALGRAVRTIALAAPGIAGEQVAAMQEKLVEAEATIERVKAVAQSRAVSSFGGIAVDKALDAALRGS